MRCLVLVLLSSLIVPLPSRAAERLPCGFVPPFSGVPTKESKERPPSDGHLDSELYPIRVHFLDGDQDLAPATLETAEISWEQQVEDWGWEAPAGDGELGGTDALDYYLYDTEFGGYASADDWWESTDQVHCIGHIVINRLMEPDSIRMTVPHEFNHILQLWTDCVEDPQLFESSAVYAEDWPFPELDYAWSFAAAFQDGYYRSLDYYDYAQPPQYGSFIFLQFLAERFGDGTPVSTLELWEDAVQGDWDNSNTWMDALERWLEPRWPVDAPVLLDGELHIERAYQEFGEWRYFLGSHADDEHLQHGHPDAPYGLDLVPIGTASRATLEQGPATVDLPHPMAELSAGVIEVRHPREEWTVAASLEADAGEDRWALGLVALDDSEHVLERTWGDVGSAAAKVEAPVADGTETMLLVVANVGDGTLDPREDDWGGTGAQVVVDVGLPVGDDDDDGGDDDVVLVGDGGCECASGAGRSAAAGPLFAALCGGWLLRRRRTRRPRSGVPITSDRIPG